MTKESLVSAARTLAANTGGSIRHEEVEQAVDGYQKYHSSFGGSVDARKAQYADMVNKYYDLATSFYEYGWGESFHFAHRQQGESLRESIKRHEHYLALRLALRPGMQVVDVGCGVGGPLREIAAFSGASIVGLNNNAYQITRGQAINERMGRDRLCSFLKADFMNIPVEDGTYDAAYQIEATCHAPDAVGVYKEIHRVLKPGSLFAGYEWCMTEEYNPADEHHRTLKADIELGNGLPDIRTTKECFAALRAAGFEASAIPSRCQMSVEHSEDLALTAQVPWYQPLAPSLFSWSGFRLTTPGRFLTRNLVFLLEKARLAPAGSSQVSQFLERGADALVAGGRANIFTPMFFFVARKPSHRSPPAGQI
eukprot:jgi/Chlat1/8399/Chrsp80S07829